MPVIEVSESSFSRIQQVVTRLGDTYLDAEKALANLAKKRGKDANSAAVRMEISQVLKKFGGAGSSAAAAVDVLLDHWEASVAGFHGGSGSRKSDASDGREFDADTPPDLRHTRVLSARFGNRPATGWNNLVHAAHIEASSALASPERLKKVSKSNLMIGRAGSEETKKGYRYVSDINISIQNVSAEQAWLNVLGLARYVKAEVAVDFEWMEKSDAAYPGEKGRLRWR